MGSTDDVKNVVIGLFLLVSNFLFQVSAFTQAKKLKFGHNNFGERTVCNLQTRRNFQKKSGDSVLVPLFNKVAGLLASNFIKMRLQHRS